MGDPSRRAPQPARRLAAGALALCLAAPSPAAAAALRRASVPGSLDGLRDAVSSAGWAPPAALAPAPTAAVPAGLSRPPAGPAPGPASLAALTAALEAPEPRVGAVRAAAAALAESFPAAGDWLGLRLLGPLQGASDAAALPAPVLTAARAGLGELRAALGLGAVPAGAGASAAPSALLDAAAARLAGFAPPSLGPGAAPIVLASAPLAPASAPGRFAPAPAAPARAREEQARLDRLAQGADLAAPPAGDARSVEELLARLDGTLSAADPAAGAGGSEAAESRWAALDALRRLLGRTPDPAEPVSAPRPDLAGSELERRVVEASARVEAAQARLQAGLAERDAADSLLAVAERARQAALRERRAGRETLEFRRNYARLAMVMDLSYSLNVLNAADTALGRMLALVEGKFAAIDERRRSGAAAGSQAAEQAARVEEWRREAREGAASDRQQSADFASLAGRASALAAAVERFRTQVPAQLSAMDARDRGRSPDAPTEYARRLALLPQLAERLRTGAGGGGVSELSRPWLQAKSREISGNRVKLADADRQIASAPIEFAGVLIAAVPGVPANSLRNPDIAATRAMLAARKVYWRALAEEHRGYRDDAALGLDPSATARVTDDFGDSIPKSYAAWRAEERAKAERLRSVSEPVAAEADADSARFEALVPGAALPRLAGRSPDERRTLLTELLDKLDAVRPPEGTAGYEAGALRIDISRAASLLADLTCEALKAQGVAAALDRPVDEILPEARARFTESSAAMERVLSDAAADEAYLDAGLPRSGAQALVDRKRALVTATLAPMLERLQAFIDGVLLPFVDERIAQSAPEGEGDGYATLYAEKKKLYERVRDGLRSTLPWALATGGAAAGDRGAALRGIATVRTTYQDYKGTVTSYLDQMRRRKDPDNAETEPLYGENVPYSLVKRAAVYRAERTARASRLNQLAGELAAILTELDGLTGGRRRLAERFRLPAGLGDDSAAALNALADRRVLQDLAAELKAVGDEAAAQPGGDISVGGGDGGIPTGTQPPVTVSPAQRTALLVVEAVKRLVPSTTTGAAGGPGAGSSYAESLARYLFADALVSSSESYLTDRIPVFEAFLRRADAVLDSALADSDLDAAWVQGDLSGGEGVLSRKAALLGRLRDVAREGGELFGEKARWSEEGVGTVDRVQSYYDTLSEVYRSGGEALDAEERAAREMRDALQRQRQGIRDQRQTVAGWLRQLDDPRESAMDRVRQNMSAIQERTRAVLETNIDARRAERQKAAAAAEVERALRQLGVEREALAALLEEVGDAGRLSPETAARALADGRRSPAWLAAGPRGPQTLVIPKGSLASFLSQLFAAFAPDTAARDLVELRETILRDPSSLARLLPGAGFAEFGEGTDGFYLVYQTEFSTPGGLESSQQVTLGNVLRLWGSNVSVVGHRFASPPSEGNAPFGDQGVTVRVESLDSDRMVNYLDVTFHKLVQDIPSDLGVAGQAREARMMVFDDFALMLADGKVYFGAAGFADLSSRDPSGGPQYYGMNLKTRVKFTEVLSLNAEQTELLARDPRRFLQTVNLDFTNFDPSLDETFTVEAEGQDRRYSRSRVGVGVDLGRALGQRDSFTMDIHYTRVEGTAEASQDSLGATVIKGFSFDVAGTPATLGLEAGYELGERYDSVLGRATFALPDLGVAVSAQGKVLGSASAYYAEVRKRLGENSSAALSYGSRYIGLNDRLAVSLESSFTLGQLWRAAAGDAAADLTGGRALAAFERDLDGFFTREARDPAMAELQRVFDADIGRRLVSLEIGRLSREVGELVRAGAFLDNVRTGAMVGFVSGPVGPGTAERATGGGFQAGTRTDATLTRSQRALVESRSTALLELGLDLQERLLELVHAWQASIASLATARWRRAIALFVAAHAQDPVLAAEARADAAAAAGLERQAALRYNALTGRGPDEALPFEGLNPQDLDRLLFVVSRAMASPERLGRLIARARSTLDIPRESAHVLDWIPWVERLTFSVGTQLPDLLSSQALGFSLTVRLPVYDPASGHADAALELTDRAVLAEMASRLSRVRLRARGEALAAESWRSQAESLAERAPSVANRVADALRSFRNALIQPSELRAAVRDWSATLGSLVEARVQGSLQAAWAVLDMNAAAVAGRPRDPGVPGTWDEAFDAAVTRSPDWEALALRSAAARELLEASDRRVRRVDLDLSAGANLTATGVALIPAFGFTGLGAWPTLSVELAPAELRDLEVSRRGAERELYSRWQDKVAADAAAELARAAGEAAFDARAQDICRESPGEVPAGLCAALHARRRESEAAANHLLGRPLEARWLPSDPETALAALERRLAGADPVAAARDVLASRVVVARAVEQAVDSGLRVERLRLEPVSLVGRSLSRLLSALTGEGGASPELVAAARERVIEAERALEAFEADLPAARARLAAEMQTARARRAALEGRTDPASRLARLELDRAIFRCRAGLLALGAGSAPPAAAAAPSTWAQLRERLRAAALASEPERAEAGDGLAFGATPLLEASGTARWYRSIATLSGDPVGREFIESWVEVRLRSPATRPEALAALALLRERAFDDRRALAAARASARADGLLSRLRLAAALARRSPGGAAAARLEADLAEAAGLLGLAAGSGPALLALLPAEPEEDDETAAARALREAESLDLELIAKVLFEDGLPSELAAGRDALPQLRADIIAERMSYKGFTPVAAFGLFRGTWVQAGFLEAPDPERLRGALTAVLDDALRRELEAQDRLKGLGLMLHALLASVADGSRLLGAQRARVLAARRQLLGMGERARLGVSPASEREAALAELLDAQAAFQRSLFGLKRDFQRLVVELTALGLEPGASARAPGGSASGDPLDAPERSPRERLLSYWSDRLLDEDFERRSGELLAGAPAAVREDLARRAAAYRVAVRDADAVRRGGFSPAETLDLLMRCDVQGRRQGLEQVLGRLMDGLGGPRGDWTAVAGFLRSDVAQQADGEAQALARSDALGAAMRAAYARTLAPPAPVAAAIERLSALSERAASARQHALAAWLARGGGAQDHMLKDRALDAYVSALEDFDEELQAALELPETLADAAWVRAIDGLFGARESLQRRRVRLLHGRGLMTVDAAVALAEARLRGLRYDPAESRDLDVASESLSYLRGLRERWHRDPSSVPALYAVRGADGDSWLTEADLRRATDAGRVVETDGRRFLLPPAWVGAAPRSVEAAVAAGAAEIVGGVDAAEARRRAAGARREAAARARVLAGVLERAELALTDGGPEGDGAVLATLTLEDLRGLERLGRALWFEAGLSSRNGLRAAVPALSARSRDPLTLVLYVAPEGPGVEAGRYPSLEAFLAAPESRAWRRARLGRAGLLALAAEARRESLESRRAGWLRLKLEAYAFALGPDGEPAAVFMTRAELDAARARAGDREDPASRWTFHLAEDLTVGLDGEGAVAEAWVGPRRVDLGGVSVRRLAAAPAAVEVDAQGRVVRVFESEREVLAGAAGWWFEDMEGRVFRDLDAPLPPYRRLRRWIDPSTGQGVRLGRALLESRLDAAGDGARDAERWSYRPQNWPQIVLEVPRGVLKTPIELLTGRSPEHEGYLGRAWMYRGEGGATERYGPVGRFLRAIDLLELLPDPVTRWHDPSQFPERVDVHGAPRPGEGAFERDARTVDGRRDVHFGAGAWLRELRWAREDRDASRDGILAAFRGGVRRESLELVRGRGGLYADPSVSSESGRQAVLDALRELGTDGGADGRGTLSAEPRRGAVDRVTVAVEVTLGAATQDARLRAYEEALRRLAEPGAPDAPEAELAAAETALEAALAARAAASRALDYAAPSPRLPGAPTTLAALSAFRR